jgi:hypothetical protein
LSPYRGNPYNGAAVYFSLSLIEGNHRFKWSASYKGEKFLRNFLTKKLCGKMTGAKSSLGKCVWLLPYMEEAEFFQALKFFSRIKRVDLPFTDESHGFIIN